MSAIYEAFHDLIKHRSISSKNCDDFVDRLNRKYTVSLLFILFTYFLCNIIIVIFRCLFY